MGRVGDCWWLGLFHDGRGGEDYWDWVFDIEESTIRETRPILLQKQKGHDFAEDDTDTFEDLKLVRWLDDLCFDISGATVQVGYRMMFGVTPSLEPFGGYVTLASYLSVKRGCKSCSDGPQSATVNEAGLLTKRFLIRTSPVSTETEESTTF
ncbi:hypothetical protein CASFOL_013557 [Castilleja foliolosa]|uniref:Uncharacterized protein n=1 Tax=Castilleja foliolosa TaxID=1961234 RepID=A0ABD3DM55_9LAMI